MERVYVGNLPPDIRIKDIDDFFRPFGKLVYIDVNHRSNPVYAYVQFDSARNAFNAVKSRHGYDYEGYTLQLRLVENEVRKRRDATPPPPPPPMLTVFSSQNKRANINNDFGNNNSRMGGNFLNSSFQPSSSSQWSGNNRSGISQQQQQNMSQYPANNRLNMPQQNMMDYQQQNIMPYSSSGRSKVQQSTNSNRSNIQQNNYNRSNMQQNVNSIRSNMQQNMNTNRSNMQQNLNTNRSNMQQNTNPNRSNIQQQYSNSNRSNMHQQNMNHYANMSQQNMNNYANMSQQNMNNYANTNRSNISQQQQNVNMMNYSNNSGNDNMGWNSGNDNMGWNSGNNISGGNNYNNAAPTNMYNPNNDPYARPGFEDSFTNGLSGSGRKWFNRYIRKGFSPEMARSKALEHRTVPYLREDPKPVNQIPNDPTNMALETIGNTILSLLSTNPGDNFTNENQMVQTFSNWGGNNFQTGFNSSAGGGNYDMSGPSSSRGRGNMVLQNPAAGGQPRNRVSKQQYLKSVDILKKLKGKSSSAKDRLSRKYHTQIVKDYEEFEKSSAAKNRAPRTLSNPRNDKQIASDGKSFSQLTIALKKKKQQLFIAARRMRMEPDRRYGGAYKKRMKILMNDCGFSELEAKALAIHPMEQLRDLIALKADYDIVSKKKSNSVLSTKQIDSKSSKSAAYLNDLSYIRTYEKQKRERLSPRIKSAICCCLVRIHKHEKEAKLPLTKSKFTNLLPYNSDQKPKPKTTATATQKKQNESKKTTTTTTKKTVVESKTKVAATNTKKVAEKNDKEPPTTNKEKKNTKEDAAAAEEPQVNEDITEEQENEDITDEQENENIIEEQENEDITEEQENEDITEEQENEDITEEQHDEEYEDAENIENAEEKQEE